MPRRVLLELALEDFFFFKLLLRRDGETKGLKEPAVSLVQKKPSYLHV